MRKLPSIATLMTPFPFSVDVNEPASAASAAMRRHEIRHLPVTDGETLVGVVAERDLRDAFPEGGPDEENPGPPVNDLCVREALIVELTEPLDQVLMAMAEGHFDSALVVKRGRLAGIFTTTDACRLFAEFLRKQVRFDGGNDAA